MVDFAYAAHIPFVYTYIWIFGFRLGIDEHAAHTKNICLGDVIYAREKKNKSVAQIVRLMKLKLLSL